MYAMVRWVHEESKAQGLRILSCQQLTKLILEYFDQNAKLRQLFDSYDKDRVGTLTFHQFTKILTNIGIDFEKDNLKIVFKKYSDRSGRLNF